MKIKNKIENHQNYRPEIDGLRGIAVLSVLLFHAELGFLKGGFLGVDIFFVISGYLITKLILQDCKENKFKLKNFLLRRAKRLIPALYLMILVTVPISLFIMPQTKLIDYSQSLVTAPLFISNILFWWETDYFTGGAFEKPLLHTWSLSVEAQYYLIFSLFLVFIARRKYNIIVFILSIMLILSFVMSIFAWEHFPSLNFYMMPTRLWEFIFGSIAFLISPRFNNLKNNSFSIIGIFLILVPILFFKENNLNGMFVNIPAVLGTFLILIYTNQKTYIGKILKLKAIAGIGIISYSLYLWHHLILAFARLSTPYQPNGIFIIISLFICVLISYFSYIFIESRFRKSLFPVVTPILLVSFLFIGAIGHLTRGALARENPPNISYETLGHRIVQEGLPCNWLENFDGVEAIDGCAFGNVASDNNLVLIGDSHSKAISYALDRWAIEKNIRILWLSLSGCEHFPNVVRGRRVPQVDCLQNHRDMLDYVDSLHADVIMTYRWTYRIYPVEGVDIDMPFSDSNGNKEPEDYVEFLIYNGDGFVADRDSKTQLLSNYINDFATVARQLFLVHPIPETAIDIYRLNFLNFIHYNEPLDTISTALSDYDSRNRFVEEILDDQIQTNIVHIRPRELFCDNLLRGACVMQINTVPFYLDDDHLSDEGAMIIIDSIQSHRNRMKTTAHGRL